MKRVFASAFAVGLAFALPACASGTQEATAAVAQPQPTVTVASPSADAARTVPIGAASHAKQSAGGTTMNPNATVRLKLSFNGDAVIVRMNDHPTSRDFVSSLPLTLTFKDYAGTEKISNLDQRLSTAGAPEGSDPSVGDLAYYAPWGNLALYYKDFGYSSGLIILGKIESGTDKLARMTGDFTVRIERLE